MTKPTIALLAVCSAGLLATGARADTIFEVEHARAAARAGFADEYDEELLQRYGRTSGSYPPSRAYYDGERQRHREWVRRRDYWRDRNW